MAEGEITGFLQPPVIAGDHLRDPIRSKPHVRLIVFLAAGHLIVDMNQGALPAVLPYLKIAHDLSYAAIGTLVLVSNVTSSIVQPVFGYFADRGARRWMMPVALLLSGLGIGLTGLARGYWMLIGLLVVMGFGVAAYHPVGFKTVTSVAGRRIATAMSWFSLGGNLGFALGPVFAGALLTSVGVYGSLGMVPLTLIASIVLILALPRWAPAAENDSLPHQERAPVKNMPRAMAILIIVVMVRSWAQLGFVTFLPFYYVDTLKLAPRLVGPLLFLFLGAGAIGTVIAGPLADRWAARRLTTWALIACVPFGVGFLLARGALALLMLGLFGAILISTVSVTVVLGQQYLPRNAGLASGLIVGFAIGAGGLGVTMLGGVADRFGVPPVLWISALMPCAAFLAALFLPPPRKRNLVRNAG